MELNNFKEMDPIMLYSILNLKLRDFYSSLEEFCIENQLDEVEIKEALAKVGFHYNKELNQFK